MQYYPPPQVKQFNWIWTRWIFGFWRKVEDFGYPIIYTPEWSGTIGNGTLVGAYTRIGDRVDVCIKLVWGSTPSVRERVFSLQQ